MIGLPLRLAIAAAIAALLCGCAQAPGALPERATAEEMEAISKERLSWIFQTHRDLERPEAHFERFIEEHERAEVLQGCFDESGGTITVAEYGNFSFSGQTQEETEVELATMYTCLVRYPEKWWSEAALSERERAFLYDYSAAVVAPCVRSAGYRVAPLPQRDAYLSEEAFWWAYQYVEAGDSSPEAALRLQALKLRCPERPAGWSER